MKRIYSLLAGMFIAVASVLVMPALSAHAAALNNSAIGADCPTTMVANASRTTPKSNYCWPTSVSAAPGEIVNAIIYYHNTTTDTAHNVTVRLTPQSGPESSSHTFTGTVSASNASAVSSSGVITLSAPATITFGTVQWYKDQSYSTSPLPFGQSGAEIFSSGLNLGDIEGYSNCPIEGGVKNGFCHQGWLAISYRVGSSTPPPPPPPPPTTCYIGNFTASPLQVAHGGTSFLQWNTSGCTSVNVSGPGISRSELSGSAQTPQLFGTTTYTLTASGAGNTAPPRTVTITTQQQQLSACADGIDNDGDGLVDLQDPGCSSSSDTDEYNAPQVSALIATTLGATNVTQTSATLNGLITMQSSTSCGYSCSTPATYYFQYGQNPASLIQQTSTQSLVGSNGSVSAQAFNLQQGTTYYYRIVATNSVGTAYGQAIPFTTLAPTVIAPPLPPQTIIIPGPTPPAPAPIVITRFVGGGGGSSYVALSITNQSQSVAPGTTLSYLVTYKNISGLTLTNAVLDVILPTGVTFRQASQGVLTTNNTVAVQLGTLAPAAQGMITINAVVDLGVSPGSNLVTTATLAFTTPSSSQESAVAYVINNVVPPNALAGLALFGNGFFPDSLFGWILLLLLLLVLALIARYFYRRGSPGMVQRA